jgi:hypothetical protein
LFFGVAGGIAEYFGYRDGTNTYRMIYFSSNSDITTPQTLKLLKKFNLVILGNNSQTYTIKYGFDYKPTNSTRYYAASGFSMASEYNISEYNLAEYSGGLGVTNVKVNVGGSGNVVKLGIETDINGSPVSIQQVQIYLKLGKLI